MFLTLIYIPSWYIFLEGIWLIISIVLVKIVNRNHFNILFWKIQPDFMFFIFIKEQDPRVRKYFLILTKIILPDWKKKKTYPFFDALHLLQYYSSCFHYILLILFIFSTVFKGKIYVYFEKSLLFGTVFQKGVIW